MNNEQLQRLAELLGWEFSKNAQGIPVLVDLALLRETWLSEASYYNPLTNCDLMVRLMVEFDCAIERVPSGGWDAVSEGAEWCVDKPTPQLAVLHATLAKLEAQADDSNNYV